MRQKLESTHKLLHNTVASMEADFAMRSNPGDITAASKAALVRLKELLVYFENNWLDAEGNIIKISWWKWLFNGKLRKKIGETIEEALDAISDIAGYYRKNN